MIDTKRMNATLKDVGRWKRREYGVDACEVAVLNLHSMTVGDVVRAMRESGSCLSSGDACLVHETLPTTDGAQISIRALFKCFSRELEDELTKPLEPAYESGARADALVDEPNAAETVGLVHVEHRPTRVKNSKELAEDLPRNVLESTFDLPATRLADFASPLIACESDARWRDAIQELDERDRHAIFFTIDDDTHCVVTAEDIVHFLGVAETLRLAIGQCFDERVLFDTTQDTFIVVHQEHNYDITAADCFRWLHREGDGVNACVFVESSFRVPGDTHVDRHGHIICELSARDLLDLTPDNFDQIFKVDPVTYVSTKPRLRGTCRGVFVEGQSGTSSESARASIEKLAKKAPRRLPRRFYVIHRERVRAFTPLSLLRTIVACSA